ncbi:MAG: hypothetical protein GXP42_13100 [Chloroflexi bacterium]|nr:hypothetical protein [Chloroflexota bacterium]
MGRWFKQLFFLAEPGEWDSPIEALNFILGLFLFAGLCGAMQWGARHVQFLLVEGEEPALHQINLLEEPEAKATRGYVEITGYIGVPRYEVFFGGELDAPREIYYYPMLPGPNQPPASDVLYVVRPKSWEKPTVGAAATYRGIVGYFAVSADDVEKAFRRDYGVSQVLTVDAYASPPSRRSLLLWFVPLTLAFLLGAYLLLRWLWLLKRGFSAVPDDFSYDEWLESAGVDEETRRALKARPEERGRGRDSRR